MLIALAGTKPHEEDEWIGGQVRIGEVLLRVIEQTARCATTTHNPDSGSRDFDTLRAIKNYRGVRDGDSIDFGVLAQVAEPGRIRVGDRGRAALARSFTQLHSPTRSRDQLPARDDPALGGG